VQVFLDILKGGKLFWYRFIISNNPLDNYIENILNSDSLKKFIDEIILDSRKKQIKQVDKTRKNLYLKYSQKIKLTNINTNEVLILDSIQGTARYLSSFGRINILLYK
jgi:hypothetical protein